jgi:hypothetical protein
MARHPISATPAGFEGPRNSTKGNEKSLSPTEKRGAGSARSRVVTLSGSKVARMAAVAANAVRNYDLSRAIEVLEELHGMGEPTGTQTLQPG